MRVGDLIRHKRTREIGLVVKLPRSTIHCGMVKVWNIKNSDYYDWAYNGCEVISESR